MTAPPEPKRDPLAWLTVTALVLLLGVVATRATVSEFGRDASGLAGAGAAEAAGPGATTTLLLDFLCVVPTLLVGVRRAIDRAYVLRWSAGHVLMFALAAWITLSAAWASNKFDALLNAGPWWAAAAVFWATSQLVRSWTRLRPAFAVAAGLSMIFVTQALVYRYYELPELQHYWETDTDLQARRAADPDDFMLRQMDRAVHNGQQQGFFRSPNSYAATAVLAALVTAGFVGQRILQADEPAFAGILALPVVGLPLIVWWTGSRTAGAIAVAAAAAVAAAWLARGWLARRSRFAFGVGVACAVLGGIVVVAVGARTGGLVHDSLSFRWNYWVASWHLLLTRPWIGVGWTNFGSHYLAFRLPVAAEEIKDPHNLLVHFATETGVVGLLLAVAWLGVSLYAATRPVTPRTAATPASAVPAASLAAAHGQPWLRSALAVTAVFWVARMAVLWPLSLALTEAIKTALFALLLLVGLLLTVARNARHADADDRPAPFLVCATTVGLLAFLLHNMVDFAIFETGPLLLFCLLLGGLLGVRHPSVAGKKTHTVAALVGLAVAGVALMTAAGLWALPVMTAEAKAAAAEDAGRAGRAATAVQLYREAMADTPVANPDYPMHAVRWMTASTPEEILGTLSQAVTADPADPALWHTRAMFGVQAHASPATVASDYAAFTLRNPNDAPVRLEFADYLDSVGQRDKAAEQYRIALAANDRLNPDEPRRLKPERVARVKQRLGQ